ncbi:MAG TPA: four helix bundle protein [Tepidisphaeraceae bacterium]|nr:four helix bundle protein [Tepidisphaeraceae bacterium]
MTNGEGRKYDLEERTSAFGEAVIAFAKRVPVSEVTRPLIGQLVRCGTSVGANYCEADEADSKKEFRYRIGVSKREAKETRFQIRMIVAAEPQLRGDGRKLWQEARELGLIFAAILRSSRGE